MKDKLYFYNEFKRGSVIRPLFLQIEQNDLSDNTNFPLKEKNVISLSKIVRENIQTRYKFEKTLGEGAFGKVKQACLIENSSKKFAIKSIPRELLDFTGKMKTLTMLEKYPEDKEILNDMMDDYDEQQVQGLL